MAFMCFNYNLRRLQQRSLIDKQSNGHADFNSLFCPLAFSITSLDGLLKVFCGNLHLITQRALLCIWAESEFVAECMNAMHKTPAEAFGF